VRQAASIEKDLAQAFVLYKKSAQQGHKEVPTPMGQHADGYIPLTRRTPGDGVH
jgi:TPR repeat protein